MSTYSNGAPDSTDSRWFRMLADLEAEEGRDVRIAPNMTMAQIAELCAKHDCYARVESINGEPVAYLTKYEKQDELPAFLRRQAG